jgi:hypothetical protein
MGFIFTGSSYVSYRGGSKGLGRASAVWKRVYCHALDYKGKIAVWIRRSAARKT